MYKLVNGKKRIFYLDQLRALAILLVVLAHVSRKFSEASAAGSWHWFFSVPFIDFAVMGVPLFLMISGSLLLNREYELGDFLKHRFSRILIPFLFWSIFLPFFIIMAKGYSFTITSYIDVYLDEQYWYVWMLIGVYLFLPVVNSFVKEFKFKGLEYFIIIWLAIMILNSFDLFPFHQLELSYFAGFLGYFLLGYYLSYKKFSISDNNMIIIGFLLFIIFTFINIYYSIHVGLIEEKLIYYGYHNIVTVMQSVGVFLIFRYWASYSSKNPDTFKNRIYLLFKESFLFKIIFAVSTFSYGIYLLHYFPWYTLTYINEHIMAVFTFNPIIFMPLMYCIVFGVAFLVVYVIDKIPYLKYFSGSH